MSNPASGFGSGKIILLGEHAVVHGVPAIVAGIRRGVTATARNAPADSLHVEPWGRTFRPARASCEPLARALDNAMGHYPERPPLRIDAQVDLPPGAGLGCSAALGVSVFDAIDKALAVTRSRDALGALALPWEGFFHGSPSGIDNTAAAVGGLLYFRRQSPVRRIDSARALHLVVAHSGERSSTKDMVARVARHMERSPDSTDRTLSEIRGLVDQAEVAILGGDAVALGETLNCNHSILCSWHLSTPRIEELCRAARRAGALGAKITGAGGGGCVVALAEDPDHAIWISDALETDTFVEEVGHAA